MPRPTFRLPVRDPLPATRPINKLSLPSTRFKIIVAELPTNFTEDPANPPAAASSVMVAPVTEPLSPFIVVTRVGKAALVQFVPSLVIMFPLLPGVA